MTADSPVQFTAKRWPGHWEVNAIGLRGLEKHNFPTVADLAKWMLRNLPEVEECREKAK